MARVHCQQQAFNEQNNKVFVSGSTLAPGIQKTCNNTAKLSVHGLTKTGMSGIKKMSKFYL